MGVCVYVVWIAAHARGNKDYNDRRTRTFVFKVRTFSLGRCVAAKACTVLS